MTVPTESVSLEPANAEELKHFLEASKDRYYEIWIVITKKEYADPQPVSFNEAVAEAVKQGHRFTYEDREHREIRDSLH
jgi:signal recognition particle receptor subunit beta